MNFQGFVGVFYVKQVKTELSMLAAKMKSKKKKKTKKRLRFVVVNRFVVTQWTWSTKEDVISTHFLIYIFFWKKNDEKKIN